MLDLVERLRRWTHAVDAAPASDLMEEAAQEIERLSGDIVIERLRLQAAMQNEHWRKKREARHSCAGVCERDHFAAAALTGLLYPDVDDEFAMSYNVGRAYLWADAMLRERGNHSETPNSSPNLDAAPAARAAPESVGTDKAEPLQGLGTGDTQEPVAWGVEHPDGEFVAIAFNRQRAEDHATASNRVVPLYRHSPTLTDAEREAIQYVELAMRCETHPVCERHTATLRGLLERMK